MPELIFEKRDRIAYVTINRPEKMNAMNRAVIEELNDAWVRIRDETDIWCAIITGAGDRAFSAGADLKELSKFARGSDSGDTETGDMGRPRLRWLWKSLEVWKPLIAAVNGYCLGGHWSWPWPATSLSPLNRPHSAWRR